MIQRLSARGSTALAVLLSLGMVASARVEAQTFDLSQTLWGPGRKSSGEGFRSAAVPVDEGAFRLVGEDWSLGLGGQYFARSELREDRDFRAPTDDLTFLTDHRARLTARASLRKTLGVVLEYQDVRVWGSERNTVTTEPFTGVHQGFVDLRLDEGRWNLRVGPQELCYGEDRLLGCLDWAMSARAFDGLFGRLAVSPQLTLDAFAFTVRNRGFIAPGPGTPPGESLIDRGMHFFGSYGRWRPADNAGLDFYALGLSMDPSNPLQGRLPTRNFATLGGRGFFRQGVFALVGEGAYQLGQQGQRDIRAWASAVRGTITAPVWSSPYVGVEHLYASGSDPAEGTIRTFNQLFPTAHIHLGYADLVAWQNVQSVRGTLGFRPWGMHVWMDVHQFWMANPRDAWFDASGRVFIPADPLRTARNMGTEVDLSITIPLNRDIALAGAYALFLPGSAARTAPNSLIGRGSDPSHWAFVYLRSQF
jgi:hypothetical protein